MKRSLVFVVAALILATIVTYIWLSTPRRLDVSLDQPHTIYEAQAGAYAVMMTLTREGEGDSGPADLRIASSAGETVVRTSYNYDTMQDQAAGAWRYAWVDKDAWPDVVITLNDGADSWVILSADGQIRRL